MQTGSERSQNTGKLILDHLEPVCISVYGIQYKMSFELFLLHDIKEGGWVRKSKSSSTHGGIIDFLPRIYQF